MSGNEILLNLDNCENLRKTELISGLIELQKRDKKQEFDWNSHEITEKCLAQLNRSIGSLNVKNLM